MLFRSENGVLRTFDGGQTWTPCNLDQPARDLVALAASPAFQEDYNVFAAFESGVFRGYKAGSMWERLPIPERALPATGIALTMRSIFVGSAEGLWRSDDGYTWDLVPETAGLSIAALAMSTNAKWLALTGGGRAGWNSRASATSASRPGASAYPAARNQEMRRCRSIRCDGPPCHGL